MSVVAARFHHPFVTAASLVLLTLAALIADRDAADLLAQVASTPEDRAVSYLSREVPRWKAENDCYSCHNNGDAARALLVAAAAGVKTDGALEDTLAWLRRPATWKDNKTQGGIDDKALARVQFAGALAIAVDQQRAPRTAIREAATLLAADQKDDGSWQLDSSQSIGSPTTYGTTVATWLARRSLLAATDEQFAAAIARAPTTVASPSATPPSWAATSGQLAVEARSSPARRFRDSGLMQVAMRSPTPARPANVRGSAPTAMPRRVISARPRVMIAAFPLSPSSSPSTIPAARATTFFSAPASSTPTRSGFV